MPIDGMTKDQIQPLQMSGGRIKSEDGSGGSTSVPGTNEEGSETSGVGATASGSNSSGPSTPPNHLKREASDDGQDAVVNLEDDADDDGQSLKKRPRKSTHLRRNIKDVLTDDKLQTVTREAKVKKKNINIFPFELLCFMT